jgi:hypothetical protein
VSKIKKILNIFFQLLFKKKIYLSISRNNLFLNILILIIIIFKKKIYIYSDSFAFYRLMRQIKYFKLNRYINYPLNLVTNVNEYEFYKKSIYAKTNKINFIKKNKKNFLYDIDYFNQKKFNNITIFCPKTDSFYTENGKDLAKELNKLTLFFNSKYTMINHPKSFFSKTYEKFNINNSETKIINSYLNLFDNYNTVYFTSSFALIDNIDLFKIYKYQTLYLPKSKQIAQNRNYIFIYSLLHGYLKKKFNQLNITRL